MYDVYRLKERRKTFFGSKTVFSSFLNSENQRERARERQTERERRERRERERERERESEGETLITDFYLGLGYFC